MDYAVIEQQLQRILDANRDKRVVVVGTTCTGKSSLLSSIPNAQDMDELVFPKLTAEEASAVCQTPWTPEIGEMMTRFVRERVRVEPGRPIFGTVVLDCDFVVYLRVSDALLRERTRTRGVNFTDAKRMQAHIEQEIAQLRIPTVEFMVG